MSLAFLLLFTADAATVGVDRSGEPDVAPASEDQQAFMEIEAAAPKKGIGKLGRAAALGLAMMAPHAAHGFQVPGFGARAPAAHAPVVGPPQFAAPIEQARTAGPVMQMLGDGVAPMVGSGRASGGMQRGGSGSGRAVDGSILVQGGSLKTWSYRSPAVEQVQVVLGTEGRPLDADIELWHGPDNTPVKMRAYVENGQLRPFSAVVETPRGPNTVAIRNIGQIEFPIAANVIANDVDQPTEECLASSTTVQGGALRTYPFDPTVESVQVLLKTDGRPLNARIELLQGPNNNKQVIELYTEDGLDRPFFCVLETPGSGNVVRVVNTAPIEFPMTASVVPFSINDGLHSDAPVIGGDVGW